MSDIEDYSIMSDNDGSDSEMEFKQNKIVKKNIRAKPTIQDYDDDDNDDGDDDDDDDDGDDNSENENIKDNMEEDVVNDDDDFAENEINVDNEDEDDEIDSDEETDDLEGELDDNEEDYKHGGSKTKNTVTKEKKQTNISLEVQNDYDDIDDDEELNENYLQKFDKELTKNYIMDFHPECLNHNYDEIKSLSIVTRDENNIVIDPLHKTLPFLTKYEQARILGQRAKQIECGAKPLVKVPENIIDSYIIAKLELEQKKIPFIIRRPIPNGSCEYWNLKDLEMIAF